MDGIILKTQDYSETHKIITIFSKKIGKFNALARGAKKPRSRMAAVTQPLVYVQFFIYLKSGLSVMQQGEVINSYRHIREDIIKTAYASYITELTDKLMDTKDSDVYIFTQLEQTMSWINEMEEDAMIPVMMYELKLYKKAGFAPFVDGCVNCRSKAPPFSFSVQEGGLLCSKCSSLDVHRIPLSERAAKLLYVFLEIGIERVGSITVKPENKKFLRRILDVYYDQYGGFFLKTRKFLDQMDRLKMDSD